MFEDRLQLTVERLAERLARSVIVDDSEFRPLAISSQVGAVDQSRVDYVMKRRTPTEIRQMIADNRVRQAKGPVRIPPNDALGTLGRLVIPILDRDYHLGYLWMIDQPTLNAEQLVEAEICAFEVGQLLSARSARDAEASEASRRVMDDLLCADSHRRQMAADRLRDEGMLEGRPPYVVCVARPVSSLRSPEGKQSDRDTPDRTTSDLYRRVGRRVVLCATPRARELPALTTRDRSAAVIQTMQSVGAGFAVGTRDVDELVALPNLTKDAGFAAEVAAAVPSFGGLADWNRLGVYSALQYIDRSRVGLERLCPGVSVLWKPGNEMYEATARAYLDLAANPQKVAASLHIHRSSLHWRLSNLEKILGINLGSGENRLSLHLALKLADLLTPKPAGEPEPG